ncbi:MAG TPA: hypothetical protein EYP59_17895 [Thiotrichaceae bacterium]|nr:hypothetical protein [Thiotrichaceae bacterium]
MNQEDKENQALAAELAYRRQPIDLNPKILKNVFKETGLKPDWQVDLVNFGQKLLLPVQRLSSFLWEWKIGVSFATSVLVAIALLFQVMPPEPVPIPKDFVMPQELVVSNPQLTAQTLKTELAKLGIVATVKEIDDGWIVEVANLSTDRPAELSDWLKAYKLRLPPPGESGLMILVVAGD